MRLRILYAFNSLGKAQGVLKHENRERHVGRFVCFAAAPAEVLVM